MRVYLSREDVATLLTSIEFSEQRITAYHAEHGRPEWRDSSLAPLHVVEEKLRVARKAAAPRPVPSRSARGGNQKERR